MEAVPAVSSGVEKNTPNSSYQSRSADEHDSSPEQMLETEKRCNMRVSDLLCGSSSGFAQRNRGRRRRTKNDWARSPFLLTLPLSPPLISPWLVRFGHYAKT